ncbi:fatty acid synthase [Coemansia reversa NRRL 1564]|uniref:Fatty acid synthase n=1 Tax=Coemansia reversa (strain ATCC 12441 / NRRL 1564) TaxID=763665 RepID=A0A2G5BCK7_COERN|nr:fatty acid synthase [Coemansia reversa NRRL 1564]|eukprot:PIA16745.1 fatty acid synthase [Coemansia reversa NRRL 1564]
MIGHAKTAAEALRPLNLRYATTEVTVMVANELWAAAEQLREQFQATAWITAAPTDAESNDVEAMELAARFLKFCVAQLPSQPSGLPWVELVRVLFKHFRETFLRGNDVHAATEPLSAGARRAAINAYYSAQVLLEAELGESPIAAEPPALFKCVEAGDAALFAVFGGQGNVEEYFDETQEVFDTYEPLVRDFAEKISAVLKQAARTPLAQTVCPKGLDIITWLSSGDARPDLPYMLSVPISLPIVGFTQLMHVLVLCKASGRTPGELADLFKGATGHSQGIITSVVFAAMTDYDSFYRLSEKALGMLFAIGMHAQMARPPTTTNPAILEDSLENAEGTPGPMLSVSRLRQSDVEKHIEATNRHLPADRQIALSLINGPRSFVVTGPAQSLYGLNLSLRKLKAPAGLDQNRVPFSQRKLQFSTRFLPIYAPFHSEYLSSAPEQAMRDIEANGWTLDSSELRIPVLSGDDGSNLANEKDLSRRLVDSLCVLPVDWPRATAIDTSVTHIVDFGPGSVSGIGGLTNRNKEGTGVRVVLAGALESSNSDLSPKAALFDTRASAVAFSQDWQRDYAPRLVRAEGDGRLHIDTPMSRLLGKPPVMVAGMTPSTVSEVFVSAVMRAGYHIELSGGGHFSEGMLRDKVDKILALVDPGLGVSINSIYINPFLWNIQYPAMKTMRREGVPMEGLCIGAGVPSFEVTNEIISSIREVGFRHIGLKPSSVATIRLVIKIAQANPDFPVLLQWTGGRAGGHHSFEDFHHPILETYGAIRAQKNIVLIAGSGFGGVDDTLPYLTGDWSRRFDCAPMPFDGCLFGSRVMVAKEGAASDSVKEAIVAAPGIEDSEWEKTYNGSAGGIVTVLSELGEPIHKIATRGVLLWKELDDTVFSLPRDKRLPALMAKKDYIIRRLNDDFQKPWFGKKADGSTADLEEMTYAEVANRLVEVLYVSHQSRWIDVTMRNLVGDYLLRLEERFANAEGPAILQSFEQINSPYDQIAAILDAYPDCHSQLLASEDIQFFINLCMRPGQKPVPFIPLMDKDFHIWFKKDSLWQAEDVDAVAGQDVGRVCILQGPVAVRYSTKANEPVRDILDNIYHGQIAALLERYYEGDETKVPVVGYLGAAHAERAVPPHVLVEASVDERVYTLPRSKSQLPESEAWLETLAGSELTWLRAFLTTPIVAQDRRYTSNIAQRVLRPRPSQVVRVSMQDGRPRAVEIIDASGFKALDFEISVDNNIRFNMYSSPRGAVCTLELLFRYEPAMPYAPIHEVMEGRNDRIKHFYAQVWFEKSEEGVAAIPVDDPEFEFTHSNEVIRKEDIRQFCLVVGNQSEAYVEDKDGVVYAPMDFAGRACWPMTCKSILPKIVDGDVLNLVHMSNGFRMVDGAESLRAGDVVESRAKIVEVTIEETGKRSRIRGHIFRDGKPVVEVTTSFFYRGAFTDFANTFRNVDEQPMRLTLESTRDIAVLRSKEWFVPLEAGHELQAGAILEFRLASQYRFKSSTMYSQIATKGRVMMQVSTKEYVHIADVAYECGESYGNPVVEYLRRHGQSIEDSYYFENGGYSVMPRGSEFSSITHSPGTNEPYSNISNDHNPIHTNSYFADYAELPGTITHGMWTSASTRKFVETFAADNHPERVRAYEVEFVGMVLPNDQLETKLSHVGMKDGRKLIKVQTFNQHGDKVLEGMAEVEQPITGYTFTGQGSQEPGMGMDLYERSETARQLWDRADRHMRETFGISIIDIVRNNPLQRTVYFGGDKGAKIRSNYCSLTYETVDQDGNSKVLRLFPDIMEDSPSFTFKSPSGLLQATQFTQPALILFELASYADMRAKSLIQKNGPFAGHSLGEYGALSAIGGVLAVESVVEVCFYRGMTMQRAVERDALNRSQYSMMAVNPARVGKSFGQQALDFVIGSIRHQGKGLLEIVNHNVENWQYVVAGELRLLDTLTNVLNFIFSQKIDVSKLIQEMPLEAVQEQLGNIIDGALAKADEKRERDGFIHLERGQSTIPLLGIDVPFHSSFLLSGVGPFRNFLIKKLRVNDINYSLLKHLYIPNLTARPFEVSRNYFEEVHEMTGSARIARALKNWDDAMLADPAEVQRLSHVMLIELLSYQFASPVRWIETQDQLFKVYGIERFIEFGPSPTLCGMAQRTLKFKYEAYDDAIAHRRSTLCYSKNEKELYYSYDPEPEAEAQPADSATKSEEPAAPAAVAAAPVAAAPAPVAPSGTGAAIEDVPIKAVDIIHTIVCQKLKKSLDEVPVSKSVKELVGGKSTLQNEILGDLQKEFGSDVPEKSEETPLSELAEGMTSFGGALGKHSSSQIARLVSNKMPGGFTQSVARAYLQTTYGLGPQRQEALLLLGLTSEPASRLGSEAEAKAWLDTLAQAYAKKTGISYSSASSASGGAAAGGAVAVVNSEAFDKAQREQNRLVTQQLEVLARYLGIDLRKGDRAFEVSRVETGLLQTELDLWMEEHGEFYADGIKPAFDSRKARTFDSYWNWARQDALILYYEILFGRLTEVDREITSQCIRLMNRSNPALMRYMAYHIAKTDVSKGETYKLARDYAQMLYENCEVALNHPPVYKDVGFPTAPQTKITASGDIEYAEVQRSDQRKLLDYVRKMQAGGELTQFSGRQRVEQNLAKIYRIIKQQNSMKKDSKQAIQGMYADVLRALHMSPRIMEESGARRIFSRSRTSAEGGSSATVAAEMPAKETIPFLHLKRKAPTGEWEFNSKLTGTYLDVLTEMCKSGQTFENKNVLMTGCGKDSIGAEILKGLLSGGAKCIVTTSRYNRVTMLYYQGMFQEFGARGAKLIVVPFNQASLQDVKKLVEFVYDDAPRSENLGWDLDYVIPFAAIPEQGREITDIDSRSELAHRIMLTNLLRLLGEIKTRKAERGYETRPAQVILPLSPNHGLFGSDGLYSESKIALETLFNRWYSESWSAYLTITGTVIGWTRGTGIMNANNIVAEGIEKLGVRTFSTQEMAFNILGLMHPTINALAQSEPVWADLNGGFQFIPDLKDATSRLRASIRESSEVKKAVAADTSLDFKAVKGARSERMHKSRSIKPRANHKFPFPEISSYEKLESLRHLQGMVDLNKVVVVTGYGEVGPYGNAETRWEMEAFGEFSLEGCIELAWVMGLIKHFNGRLKNKQLYSGWVDAKSEEPVDDKDVKARYEKQILEHTGIRLIEPEQLDGYNPNKKPMMRELQIEHDMEPFEASPEEAANFKLRNEDKVDVWENTDGSWSVRFLKGAMLMIPKALRFDRLVAAQLPAGWDPVRYGIPKDIADLVDPITCYVLVATVEALVRSGITDPYELYKYVHISEVGNSMGSGVGGMKSNQLMYRDRIFDKDVQNDILQETFINTMAAWVNLLMLSSSGPIKPTVGACATSVLSVDVAIDTIQNGKAKIMLCGGFDYFHQDGSYEFAQMKATSNAVEEFARGRTPAEMSRPCTTTRSGFMEGEGAGIMTVMSATTALEIGVPIYGVLAMCGTAMDKEGRSVPAPGQGVLTSAREAPSTVPSPLLDINYRRRQLEQRRAAIRDWQKTELELVQQEVETLKATPAGLPCDEEAFVRERSEFVVKEKWLTGHPKGAAAAWMLNGVLQVLRTGIVPGNRNADNISAELEQFEHIMYPSRSIQTDGIKAGLLKSFGFGQVGGEILVLHPDFLHATLSQEQLETYMAKVKGREAQSYRYWHDTLAGVHTFVQIKSEPPYTEAQESQVYLNPLARAEYDSKSKRYVFKRTNQTEAPKY